jgi:hypothetical protein
LTIGTQVAASSSLGWNSLGIFPLSCLYVQLLHGRPLGSWAVRV